MLPPGACDAHCHVFGPAASIPYSPDRSYTPPDAPVESLRRLHAQLGISRAVIVHASCHGTDMDVTLDAIASSAGTYRGVACVDDSVTDRALESLHAGGIRGIRFNFVKHLGGVPDLAVFHRLVARIEPLGWHVVLHFDAEDIIAQADLLAPHRRTLHHRSHGAGQGGRRSRPAALPIPARPVPPQSARLDQGLRRRAGLRGPAPVSATRFHSRRR